MQKIADPNNLCQIVYNIVTKNYTFPLAIVIIKLNSSWNTGLEFLKIREVETNRVCIYTCTCTIYSNQALMTSVKAYFCSEGETGNTICTEWTCLYGIHLPYGEVSYREISDSQEKWDSHVCLREVFPLKMTAALDNKIICTL